MTVKLAFSAYFSKIRFPDSLIVVFLIIQKRITEPQAARRYPQAANRFPVKKYTDIY